MIRGDAAGSFQIRASQAFRCIANLPGVRSHGETLRTANLNVQISWV